MLELSELRLEEEQVRVLELCQTYDAIVNKISGSKIIVKGFCLENLAKKEFCLYFLGLFKRRIVLS